MMIARPSILAAALAASCLTLSMAAAPAHAQATETILVSFADLNLENRAGRDILDRRIADAADELCGEFGIMELRWSAESRACQAETIALAQPQRDAAIGLRGTVRVSSADQLLRVSRAAF